MAIHTLHGAPKPGELGHRNQASLCRVQRMEEPERDWYWGRGGRLRDFFHQIWDYFIEIVTISK